MNLDYRTRDITGQRFGMLVVISFSEYRIKRNGAKEAWWLFRCDCGNEVVIRGNNVKRGETKSCGCLKRTMCIERSTKHGKSTVGDRSKSYIVWCSIKSRCNNPNTIGYKDYGGRGIKVCMRWNESFENFLADMGEPPSDHHSIDRINVDGDYCPENCRWATVEEQQNNTRRTINVLYDGVKYSLTQLCRHLGIEYRPIYLKYHRSSMKIEDLIPGARLA